jgi:hypothetical protein
MLSRDALNILIPVRFAMDKGYCRWLGAAGLVGMLIVLAQAVTPRIASEAAAQAANPLEVFTVAGVPIDGTAASAAAARGPALADGQRRALAVLLRRLTLRSDHERLPKIDDRQLASLVQGIELADERTSATRYIARLTVRFRPDGVRALLRAAAIHYSESIARPTVVVPVFEVDGAFLLWDDTNPWRESWAAADRGDSLLRLVTPLGDLSDIGAIDAERALADDRAALMLLARRYGASDALVIHAALTPRTDESAEDAASSFLTVNIARHGPTGVSHGAFSAIAEPGSDPRGVLRGTVGEIVAMLDDEWKRETLLRFEQAAELAAVVPLGGLKDWLTVRERLGRMAEIDRVDIASLSRRDAKVVLHYFGDPERLGRALARRDLELSDEGGAWRLRLTGATAQPESAPQSAADPRAAQ